jgi:nucleoside-diphosphate-sugar epimerase
MGSCDPMPRVLVVGGTGQTGPLIIEGLLHRGYEVTILHSGAHEPPLPPVEHLHADVHFEEPISIALRDRTFDLAVCMYGRSRLVANVLCGKVPRLVMVTGAGYAFMEPRNRDWGPFGVTSADEESPFSQDRQVDPIGPLIAKTEQHVLRHQADGHYGVTILRYPNIYGPGAVAPADWSIIRRILDHRPYFIVSEGGLRLWSRCYRENAAHAALLAIDAPDIATGRIYNVADDPPVLTIGQWVEALASALGHSWELVELPLGIVERLYLSQFGYHRLLDTTRIRVDLGYTDVISKEKAIRQTAEWWAEHGTSHIASMKTLTDRFDYATEDALVADYRAATRSLFEHAPAPLVSIHPFRHPKAPNEDDSSSDAMVIDDGSEKGAGPRRTYPYDIS